MSNPSSCALRAATATTRSLKECVGFAVSSFSHSSPIPSSSARRGAGTSGVRPGSEARLLRRLDGEQVGVPPDRSGAGLDRGVSDVRAERVPVVDRVERAEAARARAGRSRADARSHRRGSKGKRRALVEPPGRRSTSVRVWHLTRNVGQVAEASKGRSLSLSRCGAGEPASVANCTWSRRRRDGSVRVGPLGPTRTPGSARLWNDPDVGLRRLPAVGIDVLRLVVRDGAGDDHVLAVLPVDGGRDTCFAVSWSESITRSTSSKFRPVVIG